MSKAHLFFCSIALFSLIYFNFSCNSSDKDRRNIICLVDFSDSKDAVGRLQFYKQAISQNIIPKLTYTDKITVLPIDRASVTNAADIFMADLSVYDFEPDNASPMEEEQITRDNLKKYTDSLSGAFTASFESAIGGRNKTNHGTDLFGALEVAKTKITGKDDNIIVFFSDMMNYSSQLKMEPGNNEFNSGSLTEFLNRVPAVQLPNTTALVLTADLSYITQEHFKLVQLFWTRYFEKCGIKLFDYNSASLNKLNELIFPPIE